MKTIIRAVISAFVVVSMLAAVIIGPFLIIPLLMLIFGIPTSF